MKKSIKNQSIIKTAQKFWWIIPILLVLSAGAVSYLLLQPKPAAKASIVSCDGAAASEFKCWEQRYQQIVNNDSPKAAFSDVRAVYEKSEYMRANCHQVSHVIGRAAAERYGDVVAAYNEGDNFCWSGYYHGVMETVVKKIGVENIVSQINSICDGARKQQEYSFYHYNCVHGLGHGLMAIKNNELFDALKVCDGLSGVWQQESCHGGVFMENVMSEINPDHKTTYFKADDLLYPCTAVEAKYKPQCYMMQTSHALRQINSNYGKMFELCKAADAGFLEICYQSLGRDISGNSISNPITTKQNCMLGDNENARANCFIGAVKDFISYHHSDQQGLALCNSLDDANLKKICINTAVEYYETF